MWRWAPPSIWAGIILVLTSLPATSVRNVGGADVAGHFLVYAILGALSARAANPASGGWRTVIAVSIGAAAFAAVDEWHQAFIPGRAPELSDWAADALGALLGAVVVSRLRTASPPEPTA